MNYDPKENDLLRIASAHEQFCRESSNALQIAVRDDDSILCGFGPTEKAAVLDLLEQELAEQGIQEMRERRMHTPSEDALVEYCGERRKGDLGSAYSPASAPSNGALT